MKSKSDRFSLLRTVQGMEYRKGLEPKEQKRVCWCHRAPRGEAMGVWRQVDGGNARLSGVTTCGSVWHCPVCAAKICEARRRDLSTAMATWMNCEGGGAFLVTKTFPHEADMPLPENLEKFAKALAAFNNARKVKAILGKDGSAGRIGSVRSLEVTIGQANGWHPHTHDLVFCDAAGFGTTTENDDGDLDSPEIQILKSEWVRILLKVGLCTPAQVTSTHLYGLNVRGGAKAAEYIAKFGRDEKWGASSEMTKPHAKVGTVGEIAGDMHFTPFQLIPWAADGNAWAIARWREYSDAFEGKRMLSWSPGLRKALKLAESEATDEEVAADDTPMPDEAMLGTITPEGLAVLVSRGMLGAFHEFVADACIHNQTAQGDIDDFIAGVATMRKIGRGVLVVPGAFTSRRFEVVMA